MARRRKLPPVSRDEGTPELIAKRAFLVAGGDPALSTYPLGVMLARRLLNDSGEPIEAQDDAGITGLARDRHHYGLKFAKLFGLVHGNLNGLAAVNLEGLQRGCEGEDLDPEQSERNEDLYVACRNALIARGSRVWNAVCNAVIYERTPRWLRVHSGQLHVVRPSDATEKQALIDGLDELVAILRRGERRRAA